MPHEQFNDVGGQELLSPFKIFMDNYGKVINKYEELISKNIAINTELNLRLSQLPTVEGLRNIIDSNKATTDSTIAENKKIIESLVKDQISIISDLKSKLNTVLAWLVVGSCIGGAAFIYVKYVIDKLPDFKASQQHFNDPAAAKPHIDYVGPDGRKISVPVDVTPPSIDKK